MSHAKIDHYFRTNLLNPGFTDSIEDLLDDILESCSTEEIYGYYSRYKSPTYKGALLSAWRIDVILTGVDITYRRC